MSARQATDIDRLFARFDRARDERLNPDIVRRRTTAEPRTAAKPAAPRGRGRFVLMTLLLGMLAVLFALLFRSRGARNA
jgi:hypothetical protein